MIDSKRLGELNKELHRIGKELQKAADEFSDVITDELIIGANKIRNTIINSMRNTKRAPWFYISGKTRVKHHPSMPGSPPAVDTGELIRSIMYDVAPLEVRVGSAGGGEYAKWLETGTPRMQARPWLEPAVEEHADDIAKRIGIAGFDLVTEPFDRIK
jgi:hypothetical protein